MEYIYLLKYTHPLSKFENGSIDILHHSGESVYLGLGGNIGDRMSLLRQALALIAAIPEVQNLEVSSFYETEPVSDIPQSNYLNAVCRLTTRLKAHQLLASLQEIERVLGKVPKPKNVPRVIDIDILFFGREGHKTHDLEIPHPRWRERLFVIVPLLDLTKTIVVPSFENGEEKIDLLQLRDSLRRSSPCFAISSRLGDTETHDINVKDELCIKSK